MRTHHHIASDKHNFISPDCGFVLLGLPGLPLYDPLKLTKILLEFQPTSNPPTNPPVHTCQGMEGLKYWEQSGIPLQQGSGDNAIACTWFTIQHGQWEIQAERSEWMEPHHWQIKRWLDRRAIYRSTSLPFYLSISLPICLSTYLPTYLSIYHLSTYLSIDRSIDLSICRSIYLSICLSASFKMKQLCETFFKNGKLSAELMAL